MGFTDDHSIRKNFKAHDKTSKLVTKNELETAFVHIKWMDTEYLKLNSDKTEYILFKSAKQLEKILIKPLNDNSDLIPISNVVRYLGEYLYLFNKEESIRY